MVSKMIKRGLLLSVAVPVAAAGARKISQTMEKRRGPSRGSRLLNRVADMMHRSKGRRFR